MLPLLVICFLGINLSQCTRCWKDEMVLTGFLIELVYVAQESSNIYEKFSPEEDCPPKFS